MKKLTLFLGVIAVALVALSVYVFLRENQTRKIPGAGETFLPELTGQVERVREISLVGADAATTLIFDAGVWGVAERANYPANPAKVQGLLSGLKRAERVEPKTAKPEYFERLGLAGQAIDILLLDDGGQTLGGLKAGDQFLSPSGGGIMTFVLDRVQGRAWIIFGLPQITPNPVFWLNPEVLAISPIRMKSVEVVFGDGQGWSITRPAQAEQNFILPDQPAANPQALREVAYALDQVFLQDVTAVEGMDLFQVATATYLTFDGLTVTLTFFDHEGIIWTTFEASYDEEVLLRDDTPAVLRGAPRDGAGEAANLNALWQGRAFQIPIEKISQILTPPRVDLAE